METFDVIVVGAGMAGASVAAEASSHARVLLLEREEQPGYHATGRSAAAFIPSYGYENPALRTLTLCSHDFLAKPPAIFQVETLLHRRGLLSLCPPGGATAFEQQFNSVQKHFPTISRVDREAIRQHIPIVKDDYSALGSFESEVSDIDVHALHEGYLRAFRHQGGSLLSKVNISSLIHRAGCWRVETSHGVYSAPLLVNAAGAWADELAQLAGVNAIGLTPLRRTAVLLEPPAGCDVSQWPLVMAADGSFYLKPDAGVILASPADEHPSPACDAQPEEIDIAFAVDFVEKALQLQVRQVKHSWAGLRSFVADRTPVIGFDPRSEGFFWLVGQGGHGIQIAPAASRLASALLLGNAVPDDLQAIGFQPEWVWPKRFNSTGSVDATHNSPTKQYNTTTMGYHNNEESYNA